MELINHCDRISKVWAKLWIELARVFPYGAPVRVRVHTRSGHIVVVVSITIHQLQIQIRHFLFRDIASKRLFDFSPDPFVSIFQVFFKIS